MTPGGGSKSNVPVVKFAFETMPPAGVVALMLPLFTVNGVGLHAGEPVPVSTSVTFANRPVSPVRFMLACTANAAGATTTGGSFTAVIVIVNVFSVDGCVGLSGFPPLAVPPLSCTWYLMTAVPFWLAAEV